MNGSGLRATEDINLDEYERRLRAAGAQQANVEDPLVELARLVESARVSDSSASAEPAPERAKAGEELPPPSMEIKELRPAIDEADDLVPAASEADREARQDYEFDAPPLHHASAAEQMAERRPKGWTLKVSALALAGVAMIGAVFALKGGVPGVSKEPPFIAAAQGPTKVQPPSDAAVGASNDAGASPLNDDAKPASVNVVTSEEQPVDLSAQASPGNPRQATANPPAAADQAKALVSGSNATPVAATTNSPLVLPTAAPPPPMISEFPNPKPVRTVSLRPDGTPIVAPNPPNQAGSDATPAGAPQQAPAQFGPKTISDPAAVAEPSTPKLDLPAKPPAKSSARIQVAKTDTTAPDTSGQTPSDSTQASGAVKPDKVAKKPKPAQATAEATETPTVPATAPVDATAATASSGWAVQLAAPKSEAEANSELARLTSKYAADLNGSSLGVHKAVVNGQTIYRLRVVGLTKADAAALCARLKGDGGECFIAK
jgi:SPOR domain